MGERISDVQVDERLFYDVMRDPVVTRVLKTLDVRVDHSLIVFEMFDVNNSGYITPSEMVRTISKMRGDIQKCDMVASWALLEGIREQIIEFQEINAKCQRSILRAAHAIENGHAAIRPALTDCSQDDRRHEELPAEI